MSYTYLAFFTVFLIGVLIVIYFSHWTQGGKIKNLEKELEKPTEIRVVLHGLKSPDPDKIWVTDLFLYRNGAMKAKNNIVFLREKFSADYYWWFGSPKWTKPAGNKPKEILMIREIFHLDWNDTYKPE